MTSVSEVLEEQGEKNGLFQFQLPLGLIIKKNYTEKRVLRLSLFLLHVHVQEWFLEKSGLGL